ncbi:MAG: hypothetical protein AAFR67_12575, partial [Chloroflexota bacterium]
MSQIAAETIATKELADDTQPAKKAKPIIPYNMRAKGWDFVWIALFLTPFLLLYVGFTLYPLVATVWYSFHDWNGMGALDEFI